jgi:L-seryl-tRNA(Ser) seleniumtransferase
MERGNKEIQEFLARLPSVDYLIQHPRSRTFIEHFGLQELTRSVRSTLKKVRETILNAQKETPCEDDQLFQMIESELIKRSQSNLKAVINLTGTVLHTNLGRATLPQEAIQALTIAASEACILEYDLGEGKRGDRDQLVEELVCELTGAEAATIVNNNAAAVFLILHALSAKKETIISRGELVEIGGSFRIPDIMQRAGVKLVEVGTTNRTHARDFEEAITSKTAMIMKVHTSNYAVQGFTSQVEEPLLAKIALERNICYAVDLGSGSLIDMTKYGLPYEPTPMEAMKNGAQVVSFSGDKLLGGPQCGVIVGKKELIQKIKKNPLKRMLRVSKLTLAALEAILRLYRNPDTLPHRLTVLSQLTRSQEDIANQVDRVLKNIVVESNNEDLQIRSKKVLSQIGSGSLPIERLPSVAIEIAGISKQAQRKIITIEKQLRNLNTPIIGRMKDQALLLDLRCLRGDQEKFLIDALNNTMQTVLVRKI